MSMEFESKFLDSFKQVVNQGRDS